MADTFSQEIGGVFQDGLTIQIPIFYKLMASMLTVAVIPIFLLGGIVSAGGTPGASSPRSACRTASSS
ncbi:hypothetical protein [Methanoculleus chikugoensis]|uniref:hypothetical protein n=1 Tax=Methanoculleus chikugoensis TaxID=118126 RepID=UPI001FB33120|nr:hypothetical protein [Methanoculleus chikugoensis]